jgi:hypothetical protein
MHELSPQPIGYLLCDDLMWTSKVMGAARAQDCRIYAGRDVDQLLQIMKVHGPGAIILDLGNPAIGRDPSAVAARLRAAGGKRLVAYGSHVDAPLLQAARSAGCDPVWPNSKMAEEMGTKVKEWLTG